MGFSEDQKKILESQLWFGCLPKAHKWKVWSQAHDTIERCWDIQEMRPVGNLQVPEGMSLRGLWDISLLCFPVPARSWMGLFHRVHSHQGMLPFSGHKGNGFGWPHTEISETEARRNPSSLEVHDLGIFWEMGKPVDSYFSIIKNYAIFTMKPLLSSSSFKINWGNYSNPHP